MNQALAAEAAPVQEPQIELLSLPQATVAQGESVVRRFYFDGPETAEFPALHNAAYTDFKSYDLVSSEPVDAQQRDDTIIGARAAIKRNSSNENGNSLNLELSIRIRDIDAGVMHIRDIKAATTFERDTLRSFFGRAEVLSAPIPIQWTKLGDNYRVEYLVNEAVTNALQQAGVQVATLGSKFILKPTE